MARSRTRPATRDSTMPAPTASVPLLVRLGLTALVALIARSLRGRSTFGQQNVGACRPEMPQLARRAQEGSAWSGSARGDGFARRRSSAIGKVNG
jgi:hypothetical protein